MYKNIKTFFLKLGKARLLLAPPPLHSCCYMLYACQMKCKDWMIAYSVSTCYLDLPCEPCNLFAGIKIQGRCIQWYKIAFVVLLILAIILTILTLVLLVHTRKKLMSQHDKLRAKQTEKWSKIQQILNTQTVSKQRPPAATLPPKGV